MLLRIAALDPLKRGVKWLLTGAPGGLYKEGGGGEGRVVEAPEGYGLDLDREWRTVLKDLEDFWREASPELKRHLKTQIRILKDAQKTRTKRASGED